MAVRKSVPHRIPIDAGSDVLLREAEAQNAAWGKAAALRAAVGLAPPRKAAPHAIHWRAQVQPRLFFLFGWCRPGATLPARRRCCPTAGGRSRCPDRLAEEAARGRRFKQGLCSLPARQYSTATEPRRCAAGVAARARAALIGISWLTLRCAANKRPMLAAMAVLSIGHQGQM